MSRDFVPYERYKSNKRSGDELYLQNMVFVNPRTGEKKPVYTESEQEIRLKYKNLAVSMCDIFLLLCKRLPEKDRDDKLAKLEAMQVKMQEAAEKGNAAFESCDVPETMKKWFVGKLDPDFYYSEENDRLYLEWLLKNTEQFR